MDHETLVREFLSREAAGDLDGCCALLSDDFVDHSYPEGVPPGPDGFRAVAGGYLSAFSELQTEPVLVVTNGAHVAVHARVTGLHTGELMGTPASGKRFEATETMILRVEDGKFAERWADLDFAGIARQLGLPLG